MSREFVELPPIDEENLVIAAQMGDEKATEMLVDYYKNLIKKIASKIYYTDNIVTFDDKVQLGYIGLLDAIERFKCDRGAPFKTYAAVRIRGEIIDGMRDNNFLPASAHRLLKKIKRAEADLILSGHVNPSPEIIAEKLGFKVERVKLLLNSDFKTISIDDDTENRYQIPDFSDKLSDILSVSSCLSVLTERELAIITDYFKNDLTKKEIGDKLGVTESRISQLTNKAIKKMQDTYYKNFPEEKPGKLKKEQPPLKIREAKLSKEEIIELIRKSKKLTSSSRRTVQQILPGKTVEEISDIILKLPDKYFGIIASFFLRGENVLEIANRYNCKPEKIYKTAYVAVKYLTKNATSPLGNESMVKQIGSAKSVQSKEYIHRLVSPNKFNWFLKTKGSLKVKSFSFHSHFLIKQVEKDDVEIISEIKKL